MKQVKVEELSAEGFLPYGFYANMIDPDTVKIGAPPIEFYRDMIQQDLAGAGIASYSICRVEKRPLVINVSEFHTCTGEGILPLDNDVLIHVAPATASEEFPGDEAKVFRVPKGTMVTLRPGVWHHAPLTCNDQPANVLIVLPERTYANDCEVCELEPEEQIKIEMPRQALD